MHTPSPLDLAPPAEPPETSTASGSGSAQVGETETPRFPLEQPSLLPEEELPCSLEPSPPTRRFQFSRWLEERGVDLERQLYLVQWLLPLALTAIVFVYETREHLLGKGEPILSPNFLGESFFFGVLGPIAVGLVLWWIRVEWREREHNRKVLQQMYDELVQAQQQLSFLHAQRGDLLDRLMTLQEEERRRLAQEIHDELGQLLTGLSLHLKLCRDALPNDFQAAHAYLDRANALIRQTLDQAHALVMALRPIVLDDYGLVPALKEELQQRLAPLGIETDLQIEGDLDPLPDEVATAVFRIVQEAITNIIRHAQARHVRLWLRRTVDELSLVVEDDGVGLPAGGLPHRGDHKALGILGMQERARALGGRLNVTSRHPHGTQVALWLPLRQEERQR